MPWPPEPIRTERLVLRASEARDRAGFVELFASAEVHTYLGGPRSRGELERELPTVPEQWPGSFVVELTPPISDRAASDQPMGDRATIDQPMGGRAASDRAVIGRATSDHCLAGQPGPGQRTADSAMIGQVLLRRATAHRRPAAAGRADLGYLFLPWVWGRGYAAEACTAVLAWFDAVLPGEPVVLTTQSANVASMRLAARLGFTEVERFHAWDAEQWLGLRPSTAVPRYPATRPRP